MNYKYLLLVFKNKSTESYYFDNLDYLKQYAKYREFDLYKIFRLEGIQ